MELENIQSDLPSLNTHLINQLVLLEEKFFSYREQIENWLHKQWQLTCPPVYGSVDLRNAGFKLAPIDMNLFPAGFNNLNPQFLPIAVNAIDKMIKRILPETKNILLIPESHTRNKFYWENINILKSIFETAHYNIQIGALPNTDLNVNLNTNLDIEIISRENDLLYIKDFFPDMILLNNDLSEGIPPILQNLKQMIVPPAELGWSQRLKSEHFQYYEHVATEFSAQIDIDPWLISPLFRHCGKINFMQQEGLQCVIHHAEILFSEIQKKYAEYNIPHQPFLVVKADAGTYGMAVMTVRHVDELKSLNRKQRTRMATIKGGQPVNRVIIQEGVYTFETIGSEKAVAEPVIYLCGEEVIGGFYRVHKERGNDENLNAPGMHFDPIAFPRPCHRPDDTERDDQCRNLFYAYGVVARLSMLAAAREMKDQIKP